MIETSKIKCVPEFLEKLKNISQKLKAADEISSLWFRGEPSISYSTVLTPKAFRKYGGPLNEENLMKHVFLQAKSIEGNFKAAFLREATSFLIRDGIQLNGWNEYYMMQHYGLSTRLLDWSENALIALFFAVENKNDTNDGVVWVLAPHTLNEFAIKIISGLSVSHIYTPTGRGNRTDLIENRKLNLDELHRRYLELDFVDDEEHKSIKYYPLAIYPPLLDNRMSLQKACFTIFGNEVNGLLSGAEKDNFLIPIIIDTQAKKQIKEELKYIGINYKSVYPDLNGICKAIEDYYDSSDSILRRIN